MNRIHFMSGGLAGASILRTALLRRNHGSKPACSAPFAASGAGAALDPFIDNAR